MMTPETIHARIGADWVAADETEAVRDPFRGTVVALAPQSSLHDLDRALDAATRAKADVAALPAYERAALLRRVADLMDTRRETIATAMTRESGKALADARTEVARSADTLRLCAEEAVRIAGEHVPMDASAAGAGKLALVLRQPVGVVAAITPFNAPVNLAAHKLGPALAAGNAIVIKPSPKAPLAFHKLIETFVDAGVPPGFVNALYGDAIAPALVSDARVDFVSFTGSTRVGKLVRQQAGLKRVALELGGVAPTIVHADADLAAAALQCARNAMLLAGQSCVSVQNIWVHEAVRARFTDLLLEHVSRLRVGDPLDPAIEIGTLIDDGAACRVAGLVQAAEAAGARRLYGGERRGALMTPTVLDGVNHTMAVVGEEVFGPVASLLPYRSLDSVFAAINRGRDGLQCGLFTSTIATALTAARTLKMGGIIINGTSRWRADQMPYGGVKDSGMGREGPKYAIRDMTDETLLVMNP